MRKILFIIISMLSFNLLLAATDTLRVDLTIQNNDVDWCNLQWPQSDTITQGSEFWVYAQVWEPGITDQTGQGTGIQAWIGYSTINNDPASTDWTWISATYNVDVGNNDEYKANLGSAISNPGVYYYASRFSLDGVTFKYGGYSSGFWDGTNNVNGTLTIIPNNPPVLTAINDQILIEDTPIFLVLQATDPEFDPITFNVTGGSNNTVLASVGHDTLYLFPALNYFSISPISFIITASDGRGGVAADTFLVAVNGVNDPPFITAPTIPIGVEGQPLTFTLTATDPDNDVPVWSAVNLPTGANFIDNHNGSATFSWTPNYNQAGVYQNLLFIVSDNQGKSARLSLTPPSIRSIQNR